MDNKDVQKQIDNLEKRVTALEAVTFRQKTNKPSTVNYGREKISRMEFFGPRGGILLLVREGFLKTKKTVNEVRASLEKKGYVYKVQVFQTALNRLSKSTGPLVKMEEEGKKVYVERK